MISKHETMTLIRLVKYGLSCIDEHGISTKCIVDEIYGSKLLDTPRESLSSLTSVVAFDMIKTRKSVKNALEVALINCCNHIDVIKQTECIWKIDDVRTAVAYYLSLDPIADNVCVEIEPIGIDISYKFNNNECKIKLHGASSELIAYCISENILNNL